KPTYAANAAAVCVRCTRNVQIQVAKVRPFADDVVIMNVQHAWIVRWKPGASMHLHVDAGAIAPQHIMAINCDVVNVGTCATVFEKNPILRHGVEVKIVDVRINESAKADAYGGVRRAS